MSFLSLSADDYVDESVAWVWPCNVPAVNLFVELSTQWRVGPGGPYGLDYSVLYQALDRMNISPDESRKLIDDIRILEDSALEQMRKDQE